MQGLVLPAWLTQAAAAVPLAQAVLHRRFLRGVALLESLGAFEGLLARPFLLRLGLQDLVGGRLLGYLRAGVGQGENMVVARLEAVAAAMPPMWCEAGPPAEAEGLVVVARGVAMTMIQERSHRGRGAMERAERMGLILTRLGLRDVCKQLLAAYGVTQ